jgi:hypothetical protein
MIKSRRIRLAVHVTHIGAMRNSYKIFVERQEWQELCGRPRRDRRIILKWTITN